MRFFDYKKKVDEVLSPEIVALTNKIYEHKGRQDLFIEADPDILSSMVKVARVQSTVSSNRIEGIYTSDSRIKKLMEQKSTPNNRSEKEIVGYREVLQTIHESYEYINVSPSVMKQLHRDLCSFVGNGGNFKSQDNQVIEVDEFGNERLRFQPVSAFQTEESIQQLCDAYNKAIRDGIEPILVIPMFILDFLSIHPFNDGNGRMSRLLTLLLFYRSGFIVGKYISLEMLIEKSKDTYYEVLEESSIHWHDNKNDYSPFLKYYLGILLKSYDEFENRLSHLRNYTLDKSERVKKIIDETIGTITKNQILEKAPDISKRTVERTLGELVKSGYIEKVGQGPATAYFIVNP